MAKHFTNFLAALTVALAATWSTSAAAALNLVLEQEKPSNFDFAKLTVAPDTAYWISALIEPAPAIEFQPFTDTSPSRVKRADVVPGLAMSLVNRASSQRAVISVLNPGGKWSVLQFSIPDFKLQKQTVLESLEVVNEVAPSGTGFVVAGSNHENRAVLVVLDSALRAINTVVLDPDKSAMAMSLVSVPGGGMIAVSSSWDGPPKTYLWKLSPQFSVIDKVVIDGGAASAIALGGGFAVTYSLGDAVYVEKFGTDLRSIWRTKTHRRAGVNTLKYSLAPLSDGLCLVGGNNGHLIVVRLGANGELQRTTEDDSSGLLPPVRGYVVHTVGNRVHIRGLSQRAGTPVTAGDIAFHFVETP